MAWRRRSAWWSAWLALGLDPGCGDAVPAVTDLVLSPATAVVIGTQPMIPIAPDVYVEPGTSTDDLVALRAAHTRAQGELDAWFPTTTDDRGLVLFCGTAACKIAFGAPPTAASSSDLGFATYVPSGGHEARRAVVVTGPAPNTDRILMHEWVHVHMGLHAQYELVPTWFNEGVATLLAGEPSCAHAPTPSADSLHDVATKDAWQEHIAVPGRTIRIYCQSRNEVRAWVGGDVSAATVAAAVVVVLDAVAAGAEFEAVYGPLRG
ncbi:MAG: hypothetical protein JNK45_17470 [Myxococcales bacterium]|nr:hypothetical protein [Myxococcales bacterium]